MEDLSWLRALPPRPPPVSFAAPHITDADIDAVTAVLRRGWITTGAECDGLEHELAEYLGVPYVVAMASCTAALEAAAAYLPLEGGARVGVPTWTFPATALAPARYGGHPILLDIDADTLNISLAATAAAVEEGLDALVAVHFGGVPLDRRIHELCASADVPVVEDAAHALGAVDHRGRVGGQGSVAACFSFYATKNLTSAEGGALATEDEDVASFARSFRSHGIDCDAWTRERSREDIAYDVAVPGIKGNIPDVLAALARSQLERYEILQSHRRALVARYRANLAAIEGLRAVPTEQHEGSADHLMVVVLPPGCDRREVRAALRAADIGSSVHFQPLHRLTWSRHHATVGPGGTPVADSIEHRVISLPLHPGLGFSDVDRVCDVLADALR